MLTQQEETVLRKLVRDTTPMQTVGGASSIQTPRGSVANDLEAMIARNVATPRTLTGPKQDGGYALPVEDEVKRLAGHAMRKGEQAVEFFARTGLGLAQMREMSRSEIVAFAEQADRNTLESGVREPRTSLRLGPPAPPPHFVEVGN